MILNRHALNTVPLNYAIPAAETAEGMAREKAYYEALGRFVQIFAEAERLVAQTFWKYADTRPEIARIVLSGIGAEQATSNTKLLAAVAGVEAETKTDLDTVLDQFNVIRRQRNDILHFGATAIAEGRGMVSNAWKARSQPTEFPISAETLGEMEADLRKVIAHLAYRHLGRPWPRGALGRLSLDGTLRAPWRYRQPRQGRSGLEPPAHQRRQEQRVSRPRGRHTRPEPSQE